MASSRRYHSQPNYTFFRVVQLQDGVAEIDLYDGPKLIMKFRPVTLAELQAAGAAV